MFEEIEWKKLIVFVVGFLVALLAVGVTTFFMYQPLKSTPAAPEDAPPSAQESPTPSEEVQSVSSPPEVTTQAQENTPQSDTANSYESLTQDISTQICGTADEFLAGVFAQAGKDQAWEEGTVKLLSESGQQRLGEIDPRLIRPQSLVGKFQLAGAPTETYPRTAYCEGTSTTTGWMITLTQASNDAPWGVESFDARDPEMAYFPHRVLGEKEE